MPKELRSRNLVKFYFRSLEQAQWAEEKLLSKYGVDINDILQLMFPEEPHEN